MPGISRDVNSLRSVNADQEELPCSGDQYPCTFARLLRASRGGYWYCHSVDGFWGKGKGRGGNGLSADIIWRECGKPVDSQIKAPTETRNIWEVSGGPLGGSCGGKFRQKFQDRKAASLGFGFHFHNLWCFGSKTRVSPATTIINSPAARRVSSSSSAMS